MTARGERERGKEKGAEEREEKNNKEDMEVVLVGNIVY